MSERDIRSPWFKALHQSKIVVLTGAGASVPLGMPAMRGFFATLDARWRSEAQRFVGWSSESKDDLEFLLGRLDWWRKLRQENNRDTTFRSAVNPQKLKENVELAEGLREVIYRSVIDTYGELSPDARAKARSIYRDFFFELQQMALNHPKVLPVFTTNYDLTFEAISKEDPKFRMCNGLDNSGYYSEWNPDVYKRGEYEFAVFRLHGCSHWVRRLADGKILFQPIPDRDNLLLREPCILYPEPGKDSQVSSEPFSIAYENLRLCLRAATLIIIIGYSGRDEAIQEALRGALYADPDKKFILVTMGRADSKPLESILDGGKILAHFDEGIEGCTDDIMSIAGTVGFGVSR